MTARSSSSTAAKVAYVKSEGQTRQHHCHWPGCTEQVPPAMWGCTKHWYTLPASLRSMVWNAYTPGQEKTGRPSDEYLLVADLVQDWIAEHLATTDNQAPDAAPKQEGLFDEEPSR